ncbi:MAG: hypothetical protein KJ624_08140 [Chloroflexi bacterium]|nr:hypothetical protein [Chloroflexota bacterium]
MDEVQRHKLERYLKNATRFLWGLGPGNQKENYRWLRSHGLEFDDGTYSRVTNQLLEKYGIEGIVKRIVIPRVKELYSQKALDFLEESWHAGSRPDMSFLNHYGIKSPTPFLEVNTQFDFVERWGDLAGVWFEEIEPLQEFRPMIRCSEYKRLGRS